MGEAQKAKAQSVETSLDAARTSARATTLLVALAPTAGK